MQPGSASENAGSASENAETQPLISKTDERAEGGSSSRAAAMASLLRLPQLREKCRDAMSKLPSMHSGPVVDSMTYKGRYLTTWTVFTLRGIETAVYEPETWSVVRRLLMLSFATAATVFFCASDPTQLKSSKFKSISGFLRVFVGLLLGFFLTSSVNRWYACTTGFMELFDAVRMLHMQLFALGVRKDLSIQCIRYGTVSGWLLTQMMEREHMEATDQESTEAWVWEKFQVPDEEMEQGVGIDTVTEKTSGSGSMIEPGKGYMRLSQHEVRNLREVRDPACMLWMWVSSLVGRMSQDGELPPRASPTYCHIMSIVDEAHRGIRHVRQSMAIQMPFAYVHMVSLLVHINSISSAISFGLVLGTFCGTQLMHIRGQTLHEKDVVRDLENVLLSFIISLVGAFLYHVLFVTCVHIAQPFSSKSSAIPTAKLLLSLQQDLLDATRMATNPPSWEEPCYKSAA